MLTGFFQTKAFQAASPAALETLINDFLLTLPGVYYLDIKYNSFLQGANQRHNALIIYRQSI